MSDEMLTPKQLENWRALIALQFGISPSFITDDQIQAYRDSLQKIFDEVPK